MFRLTHATEFEQESSQSLPKYMLGWLTRTESAKIKADKALAKTQKQEADEEADEPTIPDPYTHLRIDLIWQSSMLSSLT